MAALPAVEKFPSPLRSRVQVRYSSQVTCHLPLRSRFSCYTAASLMTYPSPTVNILLHYCQLFCRQVADNFGASVYRVGLFHFVEVRLISGSFEKSNIQERNILKYVPWKVCLIATLLLILTHLCIASHLWDTCICLILH